MHLRLCWPALGQRGGAEYLLTLVDRGADTLAAWGRIGPEPCAALKAASKRRATAGAFYGFIGFARLLSRRSA